jgi:hypothetical protein
LSSWPLPKVCNVDEPSVARARNRGNASRFEDGKLPKLLRIKCHAGIVGNCRVLSFDLDHG